MEKFDVYDKNGNFLNRTINRGSKLKIGEFHRVVHIWIRNSEGLYLIQKRNKKTDRTPFQWATTMGAIVSGEKSLCAAKREVHEEIGISIVENDYKFLNSYFVEDSYSSFIVDLYIVEANILIKDTVLDKLEVSEVKYASLNEVKEMISNDCFWHYEETLKANDYFDLIEKS